MSTRATYGFKHDGIEATFYIHHDGYPSGAAAYFKAAIERKGQSGLLMDDFFRANAGAEHTVSHEAHGDTEYRYQVIDSVLEARRLLTDHNNVRNWPVFYFGSVEGFIEAHGAK